MQEPRFPVYRKYRNNMSWFRIHSSSRFDEIKRIGDKFVLMEYTVKTLPDRNLLHDLLDEKAGYCDPLTEKEFLEMLEKTAG